MPGAVVAAQQAKTERTEATLVSSTQKVAKPAATATQILQVIGANSVPEMEINNDQPEISGEEGTGFDASETMPYLGFLAIVVGLLGLLGFINLRRQRQA
jgi:hypothetical protein